MKKHISPIRMVLALVLVVAFQSTDHNAPVTTANVTQVVPGIFPENGPPNGGTFHCLVYGKYCLSNALRGR
ncbi:hypothetical protein AB4Y36_36500 [Paraburkholderia sp. BR10936]|uniref:hypothetical protein n=1 Tax=unclassified Paraburkholderia TaxID=2615204 RepID=UPI0034D1B849